MRTAIGGVERVKGVALFVVLVMGVILHLMSVYHAYLPALVRVASLAMNIIRR